MGDECFFLFTNLFVARLGIVEVEIIEPTLPDRHRLLVQRQAAICLDIERLAARDKRLRRFTAAELLGIVMRTRGMDRVKPDRRVYPFVEFFRQFDPRS